MKSIQCELVHWIPTVQCAIVFVLFATLYCACFPVRLGSFSFHGFLLHCPDFRARGLWDQGCRNKNQQLCKQHFTTDKCIHQVKSSYTLQVNLPSYYSSKQQICFSCENTQERRSSLCLSLITLWGPQGITLTLIWNRALALCGWNCFGYSGMED